MSIKKNIIVCMGDLEQEPETSFEMDVMCEDEEAFCLSDDNIAALKLLLSQVRSSTSTHFSQMENGLFVRMKSLFKCTFLFSVTTAKN